MIEPEVEPPLSVIVSPFFTSTSSIYQIPSFMLISGTIIVEPPLVVLSPSPELPETIVSPWISVPSITHVPSATSIFFRITEKEAELAYEIPLFISSTNV